MKVTRLNWVGIVLAFSVAGCTSNAGGPPNVTSVNPAAQSALQFSVGTANIAGTATGMNVVVTNRQPNGDSGVLLDTPKLSGAFVLPGVAADASANSTGSTAAVGPASGEISGSICGGAPCITGTPQTSPGSAPPFPSTFGTSGGVFGLAFAPANSTPTNTTNIYQPYQVPLYGSKLFTPWGGPPAYDPAKDGKGTRDGTFADSTQAILGVSLGLDIFRGVTVNSGAYNLSINIPTVDSSQTVSSSFTLGALAPIAVAPAITAVTFDGTGQATIAYTLTPGITGAYVEVIDNGPSNCNGAGNLNLYGAQTTGNPTAKPRTTTYYTFWVTASGSVTVTNANSPGPPGSAYPAICTTAQNTASPIATSSTSVPDTVTAFVIGFDYDHYSLTYNKPLNTVYPQKPTLPASADVAVSAAFKATSP
ncbi:MAG: hypothetical protein NVSMB5_07630 [Candidatus Velthaea sp.]